MNMIKIKTRIAPTPSGYLHLGNIYSFVLTALLAKKMDGKIALRIDDLDSERVRDVFVDDIFSQLEWLKIPIDSGPSHTQEFKTKFSQHLNLSLYSRYLEKLKQADVLYACVCTRSKIQQASLNRIYSGTCRQQKISFENQLLRVLVPEPTPIKFHDQLLGEVNIDLSKAMGDFVILRKSQLPAYQLASAVDDIEMGITLIVRGEDLLSSTAAQIYLSKLWNKDLSSQALFFHHPLLFESSEKKLSKSHGSLSLHALRESGISPNQIYSYLAKTYGLSQSKATSFKELLEDFALSDLKLRTIQKVEL